MATEEKIKKFKRELPVQLTSEELLKKGHKVGQLKERIQKIKADMKEATSSHREKLKEAEAERDLLCDDLNSGTENRKVECTEEKNFKRGVAVVIRLDTGEKVDERTLSAEEHQTSLTPDDDGDIDASTGEDAEEKPAPKRRGRPKKGA